MLTTKLIHARTTYHMNASPLTLRAPLLRQRQHRNQHPHQKNRLHPESVPGHDHLRLQIAQIISMGGSVGQTAGGSVLAEKKNAVSTAYFGISRLTLVSRPHHHRVHTEKSGIPRRVSAVPTRRHLMRATQCYLKPIVQFTSTLITVEPRLFWLM